MDVEFVDALPAGTKLLAFEIEKCLGQGGFGFVYKAMAPNGRPVALKEFFLAGEMRRTGAGVMLVSDARPIFQGFLKKFEETVAAHKRLRHNNVVRVHGYFDSALVIEEGEPTGYVVMELVDGMELGDRFPDPARIDPAAFRFTFDRIAEALDWLHSHDYAHLDIKPSNVLVRGDDEPVLIDFGNLSIGIERRNGDVTGRAIVSEGYAAPEQYKSEIACGPHTDVYALSATMFRLLSGRRPASAEERSMAKESFGRDALPPLDRLNVPDWAQPIWPALTRALDLDVTKRTATIGEFTADLGWKVDRTRRSATRPVRDDEPTKPSPLPVRSDEDDIPTRQVDRNLVTAPTVPTAGGRDSATTVVPLTELLAKHAPEHPRRDEAPTNIPLAAEARRRLAEQVALQAAGAEPDYRLAARGDHNDAAAMTELSRRLIESPALTTEAARRADTLLRKAATSGFAPAMTLLGTWLCRRAQPPPNREDGLYWLGRASDLGQPEAQTFLGLDILDRSRSPGERRRGFLLVEKAAKSGYARAMTAFGKLFLAGVETAQSASSATFWFREAAIAGDHEGMARLALALTDGSGVARDPVEAFAWLGRAAAASHPLAMYHLGMAYERGLGTEIDLLEANKWLRRAALTDDADGVRAYARFIVQHANLALVPEAVEFWQARARKIERG